MTYEVIVYSLLLLFLPLPSTDRSKKVLRFYLDKKSSFDELSRLWLDLNINHIHILAVKNTTDKK